MTMREVLAPCPFCGCAGISTEGWLSACDARPTCDNCGATTESVAGWNRRASLSNPESRGAPEGYKLVPAQASRAWAYAYANWRQGQSSTPRCESPGERDIEWCRDKIAEVLATAPPPPAPAQPRVEECCFDGLTASVPLWDAAGWFRLSGPEGVALDLAPGSRMSGVRVAPWEHRPGAPRPVSAPSVGVKVKDIDWRDMTYKGCEEWVGHCALSTSFTVKDEGSQDEYRFVVRPFLAERTSFPTSEEAKAAAQADYELSWLRKVAATARKMTADIDFEEAKDHASRYPGTLGPPLSTTAGRIRDIMIALDAASACRAALESSDD